MGYENEQPAPPAAQPEPDNQLAVQVDNLTQEVELMREDQALRNSGGGPPPEPSAAPEVNVPTTLLVYRDGHQMEAQNYAILGTTVWVFSDHMTRRVRLADLDLAATERVNEKRGVDFVIPDAQ